MNESSLPVLLFALLVLTSGLPAAIDPYPTFGDRRIRFPDVPGYCTLKCDFHIHTIFSDGKVWPNMRVEEAVREGLDAIAITDHLEWNPHRADVPFPDQNRSYDIAVKAVEGRPLIVVRGAEITRRMPPEKDEPGHLNALFLQDANKLKQEDAFEVLKEARRQGAFVTWNHPSWLRQTPDGIARVTPLHKRLLDDNLIQGIEVANSNEYSTESLQIALDRNLAILGCSDIHAPIEWIYPGEESSHRPITFVFAKEKTEASLKEALLARRTAVWWKNSLIGRHDNLLPLLHASIAVKSEGYEWETSTFSFLPKTTVLNVRLTNSTDANFILCNVSGYRMHNQTGTFILPAHGNIPLQFNLLQKLPRVSLKFEVLNALIAPDKHAIIEFSVDAQPDNPTAVKKDRLP